MSPDLVSFEIAINGSPIDSAFQVLEFSIGQHINTDDASIEIITQVNDYPIQFPAVFEPNNSIEIKLGYNSQNKTAFKGQITDKGVRLSNDIGVRFVLLCETVNEKLSAESSQPFPTNNIFAIDLGCDADKTPAGSLQIQGTVQYTAGNKIDLSTVISGFETGTITSVIHDVQDGNWLTTLVFSEV